MPTDKTGHFYYPFYPTIYTADTQHLSMEEDCAYLRLIHYYMITRSALPDNDISLARIIGTSVEHWRTLRPNIIPFFRKKSEKLFHSFCEREIAESNNRIKRSQKNGKNGGRPKSLKMKEKTEEKNPLGFKSKPSINPAGSILEPDNKERKERKENIIKHKCFMSGKPDAVEILNFLNSKTGRAYRPSDTNLKFIVARLRSGATVQECKQVIAKKCREWGADEKMHVYLRPATLFNATKFEQYLGELVAPVET